MPRYTLRLIRGDAEGPAQVAQFPADAAAITSARAFLATIANGTPERPLSVAVARGEGEGLEWLGVWGFEEGPRWQGSD